MGTTQLEDRRQESLVAQARRLAGREGISPREEAPGEPVIAWDGRVRRSPVQPLRGYRRRSILSWLVPALLLAVAAGVLLAAVLR